MPKTNLGKGLGDLARQLDPFRSSLLSGAPTVFRPQGGERLCIGNRDYEFLTDPHDSARVHARFGRHSTVYRLGAKNGMFALKVFLPECRTAAASSLACHSLALLCQGLTACRRTVLNVPEQDILLRHHPELTCAVLMPWIGGPAWSDIITGRRPLLSGECLTIARALAGILVHLEEYGIAHGALCSDHVRLPLLQDVQPPAVFPVELVDLEHMWLPGLAASETNGWPEGYAHRGPAPEAGLFADRFAGALLLGEMLGWCQPQVRDCAGAGPGYFPSGDVQRECLRYDTLVAALAFRWGPELADVFQRAWKSTTLKECPSFGEWLAVLPGIHQEGDAGESHACRWQRNKKPVRIHSWMGILTAIFAAAMLAVLAAGPAVVTGFRNHWEQGKMVAGHFPTRVELSASTDSPLDSIAGGTLPAVKANTPPIRKPKSGVAANRARLLKGPEHHDSDPAASSRNSVTDSRPRYHVWGQVTDGAGKGVPGVTILFSGGYGSAITDEHGFWKSQGLAGTVHIVPMKPGWRFSPVVIRIFGAEADIAISGRPSSESFSTPAEAPKAPPAPAIEPAGSGTEYPA